MTQSSALISNISAMKNTNDIVLILEIFMLILAIVER